MKISANKITRQVVDDVLAALEAGETVTIEPVKKYEPMDGQWRVTSALGVWHDPYNTQQEIDAGMCTKTKQQAEWLSAGLRKTARLANLIMSLYPEHDPFGDGIDIFHNGLMFVEGMPHHPHWQSLMSAPTQAAAKRICDILNSGRYEL